MPYKDKEKSEEAWRRWHEKHKEERRKYVLIQSKAIYHNPTRKKCSIKNCNNIGERHHPDYSKPKNIIWLCKKHHEQVHHTKSCIICGGKHLAKGYCNKHYKIYIIKPKNNKA
jgi:hypothetical protein